MTQLRITASRMDPFSHNSIRMREDMKGRRPTMSDIYATLVVAAFLALICIYGNKQAVSTFFSRGINIWPELDGLSSSRALESMRWIKT